MSDPLDLDRFVQAQSRAWDDVLAELRAGRKTSHWMWFVFPQLAALGRSSTAKFYGLRGLDEARAYAAHPVLGPRLRECCSILVGQRGDDPVAIFGGIDAMKLRSCVTLFRHAEPQEPVYAAVLDRYYGGDADAATESLLAQPGSGSAVL